MRGRLQPLMTGGKAKDFRCIGGNFVFPAPGERYSALLMLRFRSSMSIRRGHAKNIHILALTTFASVLYMGWNSMRRRITIRVMTNPKPRYTHTAALNHCRAINAHISPTAPAHAPQAGFAFFRVAAHELAAGRVKVPRSCIQQACLGVCVVAAKRVAVACEACACVAAGLAVDEAVGAVVQQAVGFGCRAAAAAFADHGGDQGALAVGVQLGGAAGTAQAVGVGGAVEQDRRGVGGHDGGVGVAAQGLGGVAGTYSRDGKRGTLQVNYGLLTDDRGCPVAISVHPGNTSDSTTFMPQVTRLREEFGVRRMVMVTRWRLPNVLMRRCRR